jgi:hypothetical protein
MAKEHPRHAHGHIVRGHLKACSKRGNSGGRSRTRKTATRRRRRDRYGRFV